MFTVPGCPANLAESAKDSRCQPARVVFQPLYWLPEGLPKGGVIVCCVLASLLAAQGTAQGTAQGGCHRVLCFSLSTGCQRDCPRGCHRVLCFSLSTGCQRDCPRGVSLCVVFQPLYWLPEGLPKGGVIVCCVSASLLAARGTAQGGCHRVLCFSLSTGCPRDCPRDCPRGLSLCVVFQPLYWLPKGLPKGVVIVCCVSASLLAARGTAQGGCHRVLCFSLSTGCQRDCPRDCPRGVSSCVVFQPLYWLP